MPRIVLSLADWRRVARELTAMHNAAAPPGLRERVRALLEHAPPGWPEQTFALELDESSAGAVRAAHAALTGHDESAGQRAASISEANQIIHDHQHRR